MDGHGREWWNRSGSDGGSFFRAWTRGGSRGLSVDEWVGASGAAAAMDKRNEQQC